MKEEMNAKMKEKYIAPDLIFESFTLSQSIAGGCSTSGKTQAEELMGPGFGLFLERFDCTDLWDEEDEAAFEGYCYWSGTDNKMLLS